MYVYTYIYKIFINKYVRINRLAHMKSSLDMNSTNSIAAARQITSVYGQMNKYIYRHTHTHMNIYIYTHIYLYICIYT